MANIAGFPAVQTFLLFKISKYDGHFTPEHRSFRWQVNYFLTAHQRPSYTDMCRLCLLFFFFFTVNQHYPYPPTQKKEEEKKEKTRTLHSTNETVVWRVPGESWTCLRPVFDFDWIHPTSGCDDTDTWCFVEQVAFIRCITADPSPWGNCTPPTKHEYGETLGDLEPVYDLFTSTSEFTLAFVKQVVFLPVNHRGPLPLREIHSTDETWVWRDPGGSWARLRPVHDHKWIHPAEGCDTCGPRVN